MSPRRAASLAVLAFLFAACQASQPGATQPGGSDGAGLPSAAATAAPPESIGPPPSPTPPDETTPVTLDPGLLDYLPATINGTGVTESVDEATQALTNATLPRIATSVDAGVAVDAGSGDLVYAWVVRLRPDTFGEGLYGQWRDSYDEGACSGAGGAVGRAEATIAGRTVYITSCVQSLRTYHVWLKDQNILVSASATGDARFGELLMGNLRVPLPSPSLAPS